MAEETTSSKTKKPLVKIKPKAKNSLLKSKNYKWTWADFDDWDLAKQKDRWPFYFENENPLKAAQKAIVKRNQELLEDKNAWQQKMAAFLVLLEKIEVEHERNTKRDQFEIHFDWAIFTNALECKGISFPCNVEFENATFGDIVWFNEVTFVGNAGFSGAKFEGPTWFIDAKIKGDAVFVGATFESGAWFKRVKFTNIFAQDMKVKKYLTISSTFESADFCRLSVEGTSKFSGSEFKTVPDFTDNKLDRPPEVAGMIVPPPDMVYEIKNVLGDKIRYWPFKLAADHQAVAKYRKLKAMALAANDHEKDGEFFAYEMMAKRGHETVGFFPLLLNSLYWVLSFYGQSIARPCWALLASFFTFWALGLAMIKYMSGSLQEIGFAAVHSALNSMPLIGTLFRTTSIPKGHTSWHDETYHQLVGNGLSPDWWAAISAGQQIFGAVLFFLLFLGLRNKFRIK